MDKPLTPKESVAIIPVHFRGHAIQKEHSRHRSFNNFIVNAVSAIAAYCFFPKKPAISIELYSDNQLMLF